MQIEHRDQGCSSVLRQTADGEWYHQLHLLFPESIQDNSSLAHSYLLEDIIFISDGNVYFPHLLVAHKLLVDIQHSKS